MPKKLTPEEKQKREEESAAKEQSKLINKVKKDCIQRVLKKKNGINWPCELKIINKLVAKFPNIDFWRTFDTNFSFALPSFAWFLGEKGNDYLVQEYRRATTDLSALIKKQEAPPVQEENIVVEKIEIIKKPLTLKDFLK